MPQRTVRRLRTAAIVGLIVAATLPSLAGHGLAPVARIHTGVPARRAAVPPGGPTTTLDPPASAAASTHPQVNLQLTAAVGAMVSKFIVACG